MFFIVYSPYVDGVEGHTALRTDEALTAITGKSSVIAEHTIGNMWVERLYLDTDTKGIDEERQVIVIKTQGLRSICLDGRRE